MLERSSSAESAFNMMVIKTGRSARASAFALSLLASCATETNDTDQTGSPLPDAGSAGVGGTASPDAGTHAGGASGGAAAGAPNSGSAALGGGGSGGAASVAGAGGASAGSGGAGQGGAGGSGGSAGMAGSGGNATNRCDATKLAIQAGAASSEENDTYPPSLAYDGNASSRWASAHSEPHWISFDLGEKAHVSRVLIHWEAAYGKSYRIELADDAAGPWSSVFQEANGDGGTDNLTALTPSNGRYVRMYGVTRGTIYGFSIHEFEIYGDLDETCK